MPEAEEVLAEQREGVLLLTLNRPDRLNAWTGRMRRRYLELLVRAERDPAVRVIVLTGTGRGFCAGTDPADPAGAGSGAGSRGDEQQGSPYPLLMRKPLIAAINGPTAGAGLVVALHADVRLASTEARFTTAFSRRELLAEYGVAWLLPRLIGVGEAVDLLLSPRTLSGTQAHELGLVDQVLPPGQVLDAAVRHARALVRERSATSAAEVKQRTRALLDTGPDPAAGSGQGVLTALLGIESSGRGTQLGGSERGLRDRTT